MLYNICITKEKNQCHFPMVVHVAASISIEMKKGIFILMTTVKFWGHNCRPMINDLLW
jgi:hypothetical protein